MNFDFIFELCCDLLIWFDNMWLRLYLVDFWACTRNRWNAAQFYFILFYLSEIDKKKKNMKYKCSRSDL